MNINLSANEAHKEIMRKAMMSVFKSYLNYSDDFSFVIMNNNNWDNELPEEISEIKSFSLTLKGWSKENSFINENGEIIITVAFGEEIFQKILYEDELLAVTNSDNETVFIKDFEEELYSEKNKHLKPNDEGIKNSMEAFMKNNKNIYKL